MEFTIISVIVFGSITMCLVLLLNLAEKKLLPLQPGDIRDTYANVDDLVEEFGYKPRMSVRQGVENFVAWYKQYNNI